MMFWSRFLLPPEVVFVRRFFGAALDSVLPKQRLYLRRLGDTRRALSMNGGRLYLPRAFFEGGNPRKPLRLSHPMIAGIVAHELLHQWQRLQGRAVTREALLLQTKALCLRHDPYVYQRCDDAAAMLQTFIGASVEQQGQIWEDHVSAVVSGRPLACMGLVQAHVGGNQVAGLKAAIKS